MTIEDFLTSIDRNEKPKDLYLLALWYDARGDWDTAHALVDKPSDPDASWIHAYLHRKEGDNWNANYWYRLSGRSFPSISLEEEWKQQAKYFLGKT